MSRKFIATVVAAALAVATIGNTSARADEDIARALAALVGVAVVGAIINHQLKDDKKDKVVTRYKDKPVADVWSQEGRTDRVIRRAEPRPLPGRVKRKLLPGQCLRSFDTRDGRARVFAKKCLNKNYAYNRSLPQACAVKYRTEKKKQNGYDARCLRREGYQLARQ